MVLAVTVLAGSGIWGLLSYRAVIRDFDGAINQAPHQPQLVDAVAALLGPLKQEAPPQEKSPRDTDQFYQNQVRTFLERLQQSEATIADFHRKLALMQVQEVVARRSFATEPRLLRIQVALTRVRTDAERLKTLTQRGERESLVRKMRSDIIEMLEAARGVPDPVEGLNPELNRARHAYRTSLFLVTIASGIVLLLLVLFIYTGYQSIFVPIRRLYEGARRVETRIDAPDLDYPVVLNTHDEMAELASAFRSMVRRFRELRDDLDQQVDDRSRQLVRSERMVGVGYLASGVAHEINNPLSAIVMASDSLVERLQSHRRELGTDDYEVMLQYLRMIQDESDRCSEITRRLLDFARGQDQTHSRIDVTSMIRDVLQMVKHIGRFRSRNIQFEHTHPCYLVLNGGEIKQVLLNLTANALEAMDDGGLLQIRIQELTDEVLITFQDDGCGMTPEVQERLFEPFFTQRRGGQGTGLGLSISHRIIQDHEGTIRAESAGPGKGSVFSIRLPRKLAGQIKAA